MTLRHDADGFLIGSPIGPVTLRGVMADTLGGFLARILHEPKTAG